MNTQEEYSSDDIDDTDINYNDLSIFDNSEYSEDSEYSDDSDDDIPPLPPMKKLLSGLNELINGTPKQTKNNIMYSNNIHEMPTEDKVVKETTITIRQCAIKNGNKTILEPIYIASSDDEEYGLYLRDDPDDVLTLEGVVYFRGIPDEIQILKYVKNLNTYTAVNIARKPPLIDEDHANFRKVKGTWDGTGQNPIQPHKINLVKKDTQTTKKDLSSLKNEILENLKRSASARQKSQKIVSSADTKKDLSSLKNEILENLKRSASARQKSQKIVSSADTKKDLSSLKNEILENLKRSASARQKSQKIVSSADTKRELLKFKNEVLSNLKRNTKAREKSQRIVSNADIKKDMSMIVPQPKYNNKVDMISIPGSLIRGMMPDASGKTMSVHELLLNIRKENPDMSRLEARKLANEIYEGSEKIRKGIKREKTAQRKATKVLKPKTTKTTRKQSLKQFFKKSNPLLATKDIDRMVEEMNRIGFKEEYEKTGDIQLALAVIIARAQGHDVESAYYEGDENKETAKVKAILKDMSLTKNKALQYVKNAKEARATAVQKVKNADLKRDMALTRNSALKYIEKSKKARDKTGAMIQNIDRMREYPTMAKDVNNLQTEFNRSGIGDLFESFLKSYDIKPKITTPLPIFESTRREKKRDPAVPLFPSPTWGENIFATTMEPKRDIMSLKKFKIKFYEMNNTFPFADIARNPKDKVAEEVYDVITLKKDRANTSPRTQKFIYEVIKYIQFIDMYVEENGSDVFKFKNREPHTYPSYRNLKYDRLLGKYDYNVYSYAYDHFKNAKEAMASMHEYLKDDPVHDDPIKITVVEDGEKDEDPIKITVVEDGEKDEDTEEDEFSDIE